MKFSKVRTVKSPNRGTPQSAGIDFYVPQRFKRNKEGKLVPQNEFVASFVKDLEAKNPAVLVYYNNKIIIRPQERLMIPSGIRVNFSEPVVINTPSGPAHNPYGLMLVAHNKSGVGTKKGLDRLAEVADSDYQGELHISVVNTGTVDQEILPGEKLIQFVLEPVLLLDPEEVEDDQLWTEETERGTGGFGSTDDK